MNPGGSHQKNNPHLGKKSRFRGDKQREKKAGRKRISKVYRQKGARETPLAKKDIIPEAFNDLEFNILFNLNKKKVYSDNSADIVKVIRARNVPPRKVEEVLEVFSDKLEQRDWGYVYKGDDEKLYATLNIEKKSIIEQFIEINMP